MIYNIGFTVSTDHQVEVQADSIEEARRVFFDTFTLGGEMDPVADTYAIDHKTCHETGPSVDINRIDEGDDA